MRREPHAGGGQRLRRAARVSCLRMPRVHPCALHACVHPCHARFDGMYASVHPCRSLVAACQRPEPINGRQRRVWGAWTYMVCRCWAYACQLQQPVRHAGSTLKKAPLRLHVLPCLIPLCPHFLPAVTLPSASSWWPGWRSCSTWRPCCGGCCRAQAPQARWPMRCRTWPAPCWHALAGQQGRRLPRCAEIIIS